jgi:hypothetical protein
MRMPSCPSGAYCTTAKASKKAAARDSKAVDRCYVYLDKVPAPPPEGFNAPHAMSTLDETATKSKRDAGEKDACCYTWVMPCPGGRPLLVDEGSRVAPVRKGSSWGLPGTPAPEMDAPLRAALAQAWLADALTEHASVASFARAALELMAVGAPPELLADVQRAALDEIEHARLCFALATRYAGEAVEPGPLPAAAPRAGGLVALARHTLREGCVGESVAALAVARMRAGCRDAEVLAALRKIGRDEERHAALAWRTLAWAVREGGTPVVVALQEEWLRILGEEAAMPADHELDAELVVHGRLGAAGQARVRKEALEQLIAPTLSALLVG